MRSTTRNSGAVRFGIAVLAVLAMATVGCSSDDDASDGATTTPSSADIAPDTTPATTPSTAGTGEADDATGSPDAQVSGIDWQHAIEIAMGEVPGSTVVEIERDTSDGVDVWEIDLLTDAGDGVEVKIAVDDGRIVKREPTTIDDDARPAPAVAVADVIPEALKIDAGEFRSAELDDRNGVIVWEIKLLNPDGSVVTTVFFDSTTGERR